MKIACFSFALSLLSACGASGGGADKPANNAGSSSGGGMTQAGSAGAGQGGVSTQAGSSSGGAGSASGGDGGGGATSSGSGGGGTSSGGSAGSTAMGFTCPAGPFDMPTLNVTPTRVVGVPPADDFNNNNNDFTNIEGDVWIGDALYVSEINPNKPAPPPARLLKITSDGKVSIVAADSGSNGLATNDAGELFGALHKDGSISKLSLVDGAATPIVSMFMGMRFDSPNDLTIHKNGTIYFTDPDWQSVKPTPQAQTRAYRVPPGGQPQAIEALSQPNGITLNKDQTVLYIGGNQLKKYPVMADGSLGAGSDFVAGGNADGMVIDCADNLYTASNGVTVYSSAGTKLGAITVPELGQVTNVAFGGADHKTLYISGQGSGMQKGLFKAQMNVPGFPY
ncbi:MAG TPA: SMP-30/gluconolactonase/LRE family protein [Polyangiaceae bacterium]|nr:SMP-30/gluconolactonase/LRE family protein [Polyangiaceae bacterium]